MHLGVLHLFSPTNRDPAHTLTPNDCLSKPRSCICPQVIGHYRLSSELLHLFGICSTMHPSTIIDIDPTRVAATTILSDWKGRMEKTTTGITPPGRPLPKTRLPITIPPAEMPYKASRSSRATHAPTRHTSGGEGRLEPLFAATYVQARERMADRLGDRQADAAWSACASFGDF
ncbi:hypothetical protein M440DRAFT_180891 [Trichoderma longibrachiatum ATCC 18648]|uniref:Uncharacterized protein n=1 Tax=Trichoderma longibrachiatum ATCC 18648 TaxID=983965 RepID=A0A2T4CF12_TRILO|nr:hypothetical protein M440DRAFT_180891 [Trichoderma longibrachiatum ATCC 18648]